MHITDSSLCSVTFPTRSYTAIVGWSHRLMMATKRTTSKRTKRSADGRTRATSATKRPATKKSAAKQASATKQATASKRSKATKPAKQRKPSVDERQAIAAAAYVEAMIARGEAVEVAEGEALPPGATHELHDAGGTPTVKRRRFSAV